MQAAAILPHARHVMHAMQWDAFALIALWRAAQVYAWGWGRYGNVGDGAREDRCGFDSCGFSSQHDSRATTCADGGSTTLEVAMATARRLLPASATAPQQRFWGSCSEPEIPANSQAAADSGGGAGWPGDRGGRQRLAAFPGAGLGWAGAVLGLGLLRAAGPRRATVSVTC